MNDKDIRRKSLTQHWKASQLDEEIKTQHPNWINIKQLIGQLYNTGQNRSTRNSNTSDKFKTKISVNSFDISKKKLHTHPHVRMKTAEQQLDTFGVNQYNSHVALNKRRNRQCLTIQ